MVVEHLLFGREDAGTLRTACGLNVERVEARGQRRPYFYAGKTGINTAVREKDFKRLKEETTLRLCARCDRAYARVLRKRVVRS